MLTYNSSNFIFNGRKVFRKSNISYFIVLCDILFSKLWKYPLNWSFVYKAIKSDSLPLILIIIIIINLNNIVI